MQACAGPQTIRKNGLSYLKIGDPMPKKGMSRLEGRPLRDTTMNEGGYTWRGCLLEYEDGTVLVEGDFVQGKTVNRIRVQTPEFHVKGGLKVGDRMPGLLAKTDEWVVRPFPSYQLLELISPKFPRTIFLVRAPGFDYEAEVEEVKVDEVAASAEVVGIVVM
ncbi:MAG: hypothetical protein AAF570_03065 [Bacteroidota bacterium]